VTDTRRPQDVGRSHKRKRLRLAETEGLLAEYQSLMRAEMARLLRDIRGDFQGKPENAPDDKLLSLSERAKRWEIAHRLARELGAQIEQAPDPVPMEPKPVTSIAPRAAEF
jgi:hypothetical protein